MDHTKFIGNDPAAAIEFEFRKNSYQTIAHLILLMLGFVVVGFFFNMHNYSPR